MTPGPNRLVDRSFPTDAAGTPIVLASHVRVKVAHTGRGLSGDTVGLTDSDLIVLAGVSAFALALVALAEVVERYNRKGYMYGVDSHDECACKHRGYEHSFRYGFCRYQVLSANGVLFECPCPGFRERIQRGARDA